MPGLDPSPSLVTVAAAVIEREGCLLLARRPPGKRHAGLWEFPGGKLMEGESIEHAIARELHEELRLELDRIGPVLFRTRDPAAPFDICFVEVSARGVPRAIEHIALAWCPRADLLQLDLAPADRQFVVDGVTGRGGRAVT